MSALGHHLSKETKRKISLANKGKIPSIETRLKMSKSAEGRRHSEETKKKIAESNKGRLGGMLGKHHSENTKLKMSLVHIGHKVMEETRRKISIANKGHVISEESRYKLSESHKDKRLSEETKRKLSITSATWIRSDETRKKMSQSRKKCFVLGKILPNRYPIGNHVEYKGITFRSTYEGCFAKWLDRNNFLWQYEPRVFDLGHTTYRPDFYILEYGKWIEIKGYYRKDDKEKIECFKNLGLDIEVLMKPELEELGVL